MVRASCKEGARLPQGQGLIAVARSKWTNGSEVMTDFPTWYTLVRNSLVVVPLKLIFLESQDPLVLHFRAKGF